MIRTFKYRIYPNKIQQENIDRTLYLCQTLYNLALDQKRSAHKNFQRNISCNEQTNQLPELKEAFPEFDKVHSQVLQDVLHRVDKAFSRFFREKFGYPRFKGKDRYDSFTYPQFKLILEKNKIILPKVGPMKIIYQRPIEGKVKTLTLRRDIDQFYVCISCEIKKEAPKKIEVNSVIGVDLGLKHFLTLSNSEKIDNPRYLKKFENRLIFQQRKLSRKKKGSSNRRKQKFVLARLHRKVRNQRVDFLHKLSRKLVDKYDLVVFEDLAISDFVKNNRLAKNILDAAWSQLINFCVYKAEEAGRHVIKVTAKDTTKECSQCHNKVAVPLWQRTYHCEKCGMVMDRDLNASKNILNRAGSARINACGDGKIFPFGNQETHEFIRG